METIKIRKPDDMHLHLRQGDILINQSSMLQEAVARGIVMPNIIPPVVSRESLSAYKNDILKNAPKFTPLMTFKLNNSITEDIFYSLIEAGAAAGKYYPAGATTNSEDGVSDWKSMKNIMALMQKNDIVLSVHGEDPGVFCLDREKAFIPVLKDIVNEFPDLRIVFEHVSTKEGVEAVKSLSDNVAATITVHHLLFNLEDLLGNGINPHLYCKPLLGKPEDMLAVQNAVLSGNKKFFYGSDSAPHPKADKETKGSAGIFSLPVAIPLLAEFFEQKSDFSSMEKFTSEYGADFYRLDYNTEKITLKKEPWKVPEVYAGIVPLCAGNVLNWKVL